jgi:carbamoyltransferase
MSDSLLGPSYTTEEICDFLDFYGFPYEVLDEAQLPGQVAELLGGGNVLGVFQGRMEFGPRALGARSIIADPRDAEMQRKLNLKVKFRESFRPFAPLVLEEHAREWFSLDCPSPYMLLVAPVEEKHRLPVPEVSSDFLMDRLNQLRSTIPAVTHVDYSARVQTLAKGQGAPRLREVLEAFHEKSGITVLVNTSFNLRAEPIVCSPMDAYRCMMHSAIDCILMENVLVRRENQPDLFADDDWQNQFGLD